jgi:hypothetical protein
VLEHDTGDYHNDNASDHSPNGSPANGSRFADDDNDAYGRRLLICQSRARLRLVAGMALWPASHFKKQH